MRATSQDDSIRDGRQAIADATKACEMTEWKEPNFLDTLAAAYAEAGEFEQAVGWQEKAIALSDDDETAKKILQMHLESFQAGKPLRTSNEEAPRRAAKKSQAGNDERPLFRQEKDDAE